MISKAQKEHLKRHLKKGIQKIYKLDNIPSDEEVYKISEKWRPYRSLAVRYIWEVVDQNISF